MILVINNQSHFLSKFLELLDNQDIPYAIRMHNDTLSDIPKNKVSGVVLSGGPGNPMGPLDLFTNYTALDSFNVPTLGLCLGMEIIAYKFCSKIKSLPNRQEKIEKIILTAEGRNDLLLKDLPSEILLQEHHEYFSPSIGEDLLCLGYSDICPYEIIRHRDKPIYGFQSHPEASDKHGHKIIHNFLELCGY